MRKNICTLLLMLALVPKAQVFTGNSGIVKNDGNLTPFTVNVTGLPAVLDNSFGVLEVCVDVTHPDMTEISVYLQSPSGTFVELVNSTSIKGVNFTSTCFNSQAPSPLTSAAAPYSGSFRPTGYLGRFNNGQTANGTWILYVKDYNPNNLTGTLNSWSLRFGANPAQPVNFTSSNLPIVFINTNGQAIGSNTIIADLGIVDGGNGRSNVSDPKNGYNGKTKLNVRGSSSKIFEKKSLKLDLCSDNGAVPLEAPLLGMPSESDWVLNPGYSDKTLMRNALTQYLFRNMAHYSPRTRFVELVLNGEYWGVYTLMEKPKRNSSRVDIMKMTPQDNNVPFITGGYILQINRTDDPGFYSQFPGNSNSGSKFYYQYEYPRADMITAQQKQYIEAVMDTFETVMNSANFGDAQTGYRKYIDIDSFVDLLIINELSKNVDGYNLSTFLYKDNMLDGNKIHAGPVWDYDIAWHNANYGDGDLAQWWHYDSPIDVNPIPTWWLKFMQDPYFKDRLYCRWHTFRKGLLSNASIHAWIDQQAALLSEAQARNFTQFPILDSYIFPNPAQQIASSYQAVVNDLKTWVVNRTAFMDQYIPGYCNSVDIASNENPAKAADPFPNPFDDVLRLRFEGNDSRQYHISIMDAVGRLVYEQNARVEESGSTIDLALGELASGPYFLRLETGGKAEYHKIVKTK